MRLSIQKPARTALVLSCLAPRERREKLPKFLPCTGTVSPPPPSVRSRCTRLIIYPIIAATALIFITISIPATLLGGRSVVAQGTPTPQSTPGRSSTSSTQTTPTSQPSPQQRQSAIQRIRERGDVLVVGVQYDFPPLSFIDEEGNFAGFEVDLVRLLADAWGVTVEFVPVTPQDRVQRVRAGQVDLILISQYAVPHPTDALLAESRNRTIDTSYPYFSDRLRILVRTAAGYEYVNDLQGAKVGTIVGVTTSQFANHIRTERIELEARPFQEYAPALAALSARQVDALVAPGTFLTWATQQNPQYSLLPQPLTREPLALGFAAGDPYFRNLINYTLQQLQEEGVFQALYETWFPGIDPLAIPSLPGTWPYTLADSPVTVLPDEPSRAYQFADRGALLVGIPYDLPPFGYITEDGEVTGFDATLAAEFAERWLGDAGAVELVPVTTGTKGPLLAAGEVDLVIAQMVQTWESEELVDFSQAYFVDQLSLLVRNEEDLVSLSDLNGKVVGVVNDASALALLRDRIRERGIDVDILPFQEHAIMVQALQAEQIDAVMLLGMAAFRLAQDEAALRVLDIPNSAESYNIGVPEGDTQMLELVNETLRAMRRDGTYDALYRQWFASETPLRLENSAALTATVALTGVGTLTDTATLTGSLAITPSPVAAPRAVTEPGILATGVPTTSLFITATPTNTSTLASSEFQEAVRQDPNTITHTVRAEESLIDLANRYYGEPELWRFLYEVNRDEIGTDPNILLQGTTLFIPEAP